MNIKTLFNALGVLIVLYVLATVALAYGVMFGAVDANSTDMLSTSTRFLINLFI